MARRSGSVAMGVVALAVGVCGLLLFRGVAPEPVGGQLTGEVLPAVTPTSDRSVSTSEPAPTTEPTTQPPTTEPTTQPPTTQPAPTTVPLVTSTTTTSTTSTTTSTTTTVAPKASPFPSTVDADTTIVGPGGSVVFTGSCPTVDGDPRGPLVVWVTSTATEAVTPGVSMPDWTYVWTAPTEPSEIGSFTFQFWCGAPGAEITGYPLDLQVTVDMVAQVATPTTTTPPTETQVSVPVDIIPATG